MTERLVILQTRLQSRSYAAIRRETDLVLPIGPEAMHETKIHGWSACTLGELFQSEEYQIEKEQSQKKIDSLIESLNSFAKRKYPEFDIQIGNYYAFQLWAVIGQIHFNSFIIRSIKKKLDPTLTICYTKAKSEIFMDFRPDPGSIFSEVLSRSGIFNQGQFQIKKISEKIKATTLRERILSALPISVRTLLRRVRDYQKTKSSHHGIYDLLIIGAGGDWLKLRENSAFNRIFRSHFPPYLSDSPKKIASKELFGILNASIKDNDAIPFDLVPLAHAIQSDLDFFAKKSNEVSNSMKSYDAVVTSVLSFPVDNFLAHTAVTVGLPLIVWQHGEKGQSGFDHLSLYTELFYATDFLAYAPVVAEQYIDWLKNYRDIQIHTVGSIEKKIEWVNGETIVYATGKWFKTAVPFLDKPDPDSRLFNAHRIILNFLNDSDYTVVFKANNTPGLNEIPYEFQKIQIEYSKSFTSLLRTARAIILDTPATTLVEACSTQVPVFVLGGRNTYTEEFLSAIKRRVVWCESPEELISDLSNYLKTGSYGADVNDSSYLKKYGANLPSDDLVIKLRSILEDRILHSRSNSIT
ncbi:hypothetical protein [Leptospira brenneri]|uniref:hypothetical protein n=1 Tax=Leptospira brenneri TaxID=2023182 RepID=UPI000C29EA84|nr:hypothetical protein [Leptospira brenneri]PJZ45510.1 hypothetical protein CH361_10825 [Leptospira brenneri]